MPDIAILLSFVQILSVGAMLYGVTGLCAPKITRKIRLYGYGFLGFIMSSDNRWNKNSVPDSAAISGKIEKSKKIIFIRHAESEWNMIFNKGIMKIMPRFLLSMLRELRLLGSEGSVFVDSPLSDEGKKQAYELRQALLGEKLHGVIPGDDLLLVTSPLRRALQTLTICLWTRIRGLSNRVVLHSSLIEISRNIDCLPISDAYSMPSLNLEDSIVDRAFDCALHHGPKPLRDSGLRRLKSFAHWAMDREETVIVVCGHSLWFKYFFQVFMPKKQLHAAKTRKIHNAGVVSFTLHQGVHEGTTTFLIPAESITAVYKGFS